MIKSKPVVTRANYVSYFFTGYNTWFRELGYPLLDINRWPDGEWAILQAERTPVVPCLTRWNYVLTGLRNIEISKVFVEKYTEMLDLTKKAFWDKEDSKTKEMELEKERVEQNAQLRVDAAHKAITQNPDLMNRIAKFGIGQMDLINVVKNIPSYRL